MSNVNLNQAQINALKKSQDVANLLGRVAEGVKSRVIAPSKFTLATRHGVAKGGRYGEAYAQVQMFGRGAIAVEFGSKRTAAKAPLRKALGSNGIATRVKVL